MVDVFDDAESLATQAAAVVQRHAALAIAGRGRFRLAVPGGASPAGMFRMLTAVPSSWLWDRTMILFADERAVPPDHVDSNFRQVRVALLDPLAARGVAPVVHRMAGEAEDLDRAARDYEPHLESPLDLLVLGLGADGHVASLFPGSPALGERERRVVVVPDSPKPPARRLTITPRVLDEARQVLVIAGGAAKAAAVAAAQQQGAPEALPARLVRERTWFVDRDAARELG